MIDFSKSYLGWKTKEDSFGRFNVESICSIYNSSRKIDEIYSLTGIMACDVYGESPLFYSPSFQFQASFSTSKVKILRKFIPHQEKDTFQDIKEKFSEINYCLTKLNEEDLVELKDIGEIENYLFNKAPLIGKVSFSHGENSIELQFPLKHVNYSAEKNMFQVETGPIGMVDLKHTEDYIRNFTQAYIAFNSFKEMDVLYLSEEESIKGERIRSYNKQQHLDCKINLYSIKN